MKPRIITTTRLLAVAAAAVAGCATKSDPAPITAAPEPTGNQPASGAGAPGEAAPLAPGAVAPAVPAGQKVELIKLQFELASLELGAAVAQGARFRPLCDAQGYPLVGNVARKGGPDERPQLQASKYCAEIRRKRP